MSAVSSHQIRWRLAQLTAHLVVALVALVVIGGATRVMEAGLACPDWPLCYGSFYPGRQMNLQVFLEWFHRLDAFVVGVTLLVQLGVVLTWRSKLPVWLPWVSAFLVGLVIVQGGLGALTVLDLLPSGLVTAHLGVALLLLAISSGLSQSLLGLPGSKGPLWWRLMGGAALGGVVYQSLLGGKMATSWAAERCATAGVACHWLNWHFGSAVPVAMLVLAFVLTPFFVGGWPRSQWPFLISTLGLVVLQIFLGISTLNFGLSQPSLTVGHQLVAALLVALLAALTFRAPKESSAFLSLQPESSFLEPCHD